MISTNVEAIKNLLEKQLRAKIKFNWLSDCVNYFVQKNPQISVSELYEGTVDQLLLATYAHSCDPVIPNAFRTIETIWTFKSILFLQMEFILDISEPYYEQWRRLHDMKLDDVQEVKESRAFQVKKKRCLKLALSDGVNTVYAMEYRPIPCLSTKLPPGLKVLIKGPVKVSNKMFLLEQQNIQIVGGEVDEMSVENAYENVLNRLLNRPITATPITEYSEIQPVVVVPSETQQAPAPRPAPSAPIDINRNQAARDAEVNDELQRLSIDDNDIDFDELDRIEAQVLGTETPQNSTVQEPIEVSDDEDIPEEFLRDLENQFTNIDSDAQRIPEVVEVEMDEPEIEMPPAIPQNSSWNQPALTRPLTNPWSVPKRQPAPSTSSSTKKQTILNFQNISKPKPPEEPKEIPSKKKPRMSEFLIPDASKLTELPIEEFEDNFALGDKRKSNELYDSDRPTKAARFSPPPLSKPKITDDNYEFKIDHLYNFVTIDQFEELKTVDKLRRSYAVQIKVKKVSTIKVFEKEWLLKAHIKDKWSSNNLEVKFEDEIVAKLGDRTAQEMFLLNQKSKTQPQLKGDIKAVIDRISETLQTTIYLAVITTKVLPPTGHQIILSKILELTDDNKQTIMLKIHDENLNEVNVL